MSSHLAISYGPPATPSTGSGANGSASAASGDSGGGLGFLAALIDQLLAGSTTTDTSATALPTDASSAAAAAISTLTSAARQSASADPTATTDTGSATGAATPQGVKFLTWLARELRGLQFQLSAGEKPDGDELQMLNYTLDRLGKILGFSLTTGQSDGVTSPVGATDTDTDSDTSNLGDSVDEKTAANLVSIRMALVAAGSDSTASDTSMVADKPASTKVAATTSTATATSGSDVQTAFNNLATELKNASVAVTSVSPALAQKLEAFAAQLSAAQSDPQTIAALAGTADDPAAAITAALAKLSKPMHSFAELQALDDYASNVGSGPAALSSAVAARSQSPAHLSGLASLSSDLLSSDAKDPASKLLSSTGATVAMASKTDVAKHPQSVQDDARLIADEVSTSDSAKADPTRTDATRTDSTAANGPNTPATQQAKTLPAAYQPVASPINMGQVAFEMAHQLQKGQSRFSIRLDPPELGRVDVHMSVDQAGSVNARLTVDRSETLDLFQRDRGALERALSQAGLDAGKTNLEFSLRQNPFAGSNAGSGGNRQSPGTYTGSASSSSGSDSGDIAAVSPAITLYRGAATSRGVNIFV